jgi:hypothetical protein
MNPSTGLCPKRPCTHRSCMPSGHLWHRGELPYRVPDVRGRGLPLFIPRHIRSTYARQIHGHTPHTYLIMKIVAPNGILSVLGDIMVSYNCESATVGSPRIQRSEPQQRSWLPRQPRSTKQLCRYQTRSVQPKLWTRV